MVRQRPTARQRGVVRGARAVSPASAALPAVEEVSAGGLVLDRSGPRAKAALIARRNREGRLLWSMPKGHVEPGESVQDAAVREVEEETGIHGHILGRLGSIDYWFTSQGNRVHKTVHMFVLDAAAGDLSDEDVEVAEVAWVPLDEAGELLAYEDERKLLNRVDGLLAESG